MSYPIYFIFALLPSFAWLLFYLRKDSHPESNKMIMKIFFYGMLSALPAIFLELGIFEILKSLAIPTILFLILKSFFGVALVEEGLKYLVVRIRVLNSSALDEPVDLMLYMIIAALGFAALENILIIFRLGPGFFLGQAIFISLFRFVGATFLHTLASGVFGYFLALSVCETKKRSRLLLSGLGIAAFLHGLYNFSIMEVEGFLQFTIPVFILLALAVFVTIAFKKLKKLKSVCLLPK